MLTEGDIKGAAKRLVAEHGTVNQSLEEVVQKLRDKLPDESEVHGELLSVEHREAFDQFVQRFVNNNGNEEEEKDEQDDSQLEEQEDISSEFQLHHLPYTFAPNGVEMHNYQNC